MNSPKDLLFLELIYGDLIFLCKKIKKIKIEDVFIEENPPNNFLYMSKKLHFLKLIATQIW